MDLVVKALESLRHSFDLKLHSDSVDVSSEQNTKKNKALDVTKKKASSLVATSSAAVPAVGVAVNSSLATQSSSSPIVTISPLRTRPMRTKSNTLKGKSDSQTLHTLTTPSVSVSSITDRAQRSTSFINDVPSRSSPIVTTSAVPAVPATTNGNYVSHHIKAPIIGAGTKKPAGITVIDPMKCIYVSSLRSSTTYSDLAKFVADELEVGIEKVHCYALLKKDSTSRRRSISFKIEIPAEYFESLLNPEFWPAGFHVRQFNFRDSTPKNQ